MSLHVILILRVTSCYLHVKSVKLHVITRNNM